MKIKIGDLVSGGHVRSQAIVIQQKTGRPVQFEILEPARTTILAWLEPRGGTIDGYAFPSRIDVGTWLHELGLGRYDDVFLENAIRADVLAKLTAEDLNDLGVVSVGHRRKLLAAIAELSRFQASPAKLSHVDERAPLNETALRRQFSTMFCDLVGSTTLSAQLDPEDMREIIGAYHHCCTTHSRMPACYAHLARCRALRIC